MKNACRVATLFLSAILICGCANIPDMTADQSEMVSQYAASLMLKYDSENHSRLVDTTSFVEEYNFRKKAFEDAANKYLEEQKKLEEAANAEEEARREEALSQDSAQNTYGNNNNDYTGGAIVLEEVSNVSIGEYIGLDGFEVEFFGCSEQKTFSSVSAYDFSASKGKKFLVMSFDVSNVSAGPTVLDVLTKNVSFKVSVNAEKYYSVLISTNDNDFAQAYDSFNSGETKTYVLLQEIPDEMNVETVSLKIEVPGKDSIVKSLK